MTDKTTNPSVTESSGLNTRNAMMSEYTIAQKSNVYDVVCFLVFIGCGLDWEEGTNARTKVLANAKNRAPLA